MVLGCDHLKKIFIFVLVLLVSSHTLLYAEENSAKAEAAWRAVLDRGDADFETKQKAYVFFNNYGQRLYEKKRYKEAVNKYNAAVSIFSLNSVSLVNRGNVFIALKSYVKAEEDFRNAIMQKPSFLQALYGMGLVMYYGGNFPEAYSFFSRLLRIAPDFAAAKGGLESVLKSLDPAFRLGVSELADGSYRKAFTNLNMALQHAPDNLVIARYAARLLCEMGLYKRALVILKRKTPNEKLYPENTFLLGKAYFMTGEYGKAKACFFRLVGHGLLQPEQKQEIQYYADKIPVLTSDSFGKAYKLFNEQDYRASLLALESIASQPDTPPEVYFYMGKSYINLHLPQKALVLFQRAIQLDVNRNDFLFAAAKALCMQGKVKLSKLMLRDILSISPHHMPSLKLIGKINTRDRVGEFLAGIDTAKWSRSVSGNLSVEAIGESKKLIVYAARFTSFLEKKFIVKDSKSGAHNIKTSYRIKIFKTKKVFQRLRDVLGEEYMRENFIFYDSPVSGESFVAAYRESLPLAVFLKNIRHAILHQYLRSVAINPPPWLDEGLAACVEYVAEKADGSFTIITNNNRMAALKMMFMAKQYYSLGLRRLLEADKTEFMANPQVYYQEAYAFCSFLMRSSSLPNLMLRLRAYASEEENTIYVGEEFTDNLLKMDAKFESYVMKQQFDAALEEGLVLYKRGKWDSAISKFRTSFDKDPFLTENLLYLGLAFFKKKELDRAYSYFIDYMELERDRISPLVFLAAIHKTRGETKLCEKFLSKAERFEPSNPLVVAMRRDIEAAKAERTKFLTQTTAPDVKNTFEQLDYALFGSVRDARVANNTGVYFFNSGIYDKAVQKFLEALAIQRDFPDTRYNLGVAYVLLGRNKDAIGTLTEVFEETGGKKNKVFMYLSRAYLQVNDFRKAEMYLDKYKKGEEK